MRVCECACVCVWCVMHKGTSISYFRPALLSLTLLPHSLLLFPLALDEGAVTVKKYFTPEAELTNSRAAMAAMGFFVVTAMLFGGGE